jgi:hypothetical protein
MAVRPCSQGQKKRRDGENEGLGLDKEGAGGSRAGTWTSPTTYPPSIELSPKTVYHCAMIVMIG